MNYVEIAHTLSTKKIVSLLKVEERFLEFQSQFQAIQTKLSEAQERIRWFETQLFGRKSEKRHSDTSPPGSIQLYINQQLQEEVEQAQAQKATEITEVAPYKRGKAKKIQLENAVSETGLRFDDSVPVKVIKVPNQAIEGLNPEDYEVISTTVVHRLAQTNCHLVLRYEMDVVKLKATKEVFNTERPTSVFDNSFADVSFLARLIIDKFMYHMPLYRQEQRLIASGIKVSRATLVAYVMRLALLLEPIYKSQVKSILRSLILAMDEVPVKAGVNKEKHKMKNGYFWPMNGDKNEIAFHYSPSRSIQVLYEALKDKFKGTLLTDGYQAYENFAAANPDIIHALCWAHARRYFIQAENVEPILAAKALDDIKSLYKIEEEIKGKDSLIRQEKRGSYSKLIVDDFFAWLKEERGKYCLLPSSPFTKAINYCLERESGLRVFLANPDIPVDTNHVERQIRPVVVGRKNWLFCYSEAGAEHAGIIFSLIATCKLHNVDPYTYLVDVLQRVQTHSSSKIEELTPRLWKENFGHNPMRSVVDL